MTDLMKVLQIVAPGRTEIQMLPIPEPGPQQVLVRIAAVTTCPQWDLHVFEGRPMFQGGTLEFPYMPGQPGHEAAGSVAAVGEGVTAYRLGDTVCVWRDQGHTRGGAYAQYMLVEEDNLISAPADLDPSAVASLELAMCVGSTMLLLRKLEDLSGMRAGVSGLGPAGLVAAQMLLAEGADEVIGLDLNPARRAAALELGIVAQAFDPREEGVLPLRGKPGELDVSIDCVGYRASTEYLMAHTQRTVALFGVQRETYHYTQQTLTLLGYPGHGRRAAEYAMSLLCAGRLNLACMVGARLPLEEYAQAVDLLRGQEVLKVCFLPWA
ncbi:MAG: alcohol dehydrogenase catalytic domain-containing protein [Anaerolineae bacterium]